MEKKFETKFENGKMVRMYEGKVLSEVDFNRPPRSMEEAARQSRDDMANGRLGIQQFDEYKKAREYAKDLVVRFVGGNSLKTEVKNALNLLPHTPKCLACLEAAYNHMVFLASDDKVSACYAIVFKEIRDYAVNLFQKQGDEAFGEYLFLID